MDSGYRSVDGEPSVTYEVPLTIGSEAKTAVRCCAGVASKNLRPLGELGTWIVCVLMSAYRLRALRAVCRACLRACLWAALWTRLSD